MRLWSLHPKYLDPKGLVALWREALLAQAVLTNQTSGYRHHPQLKRFQASVEPASQIASYLVAVHAEALRRGYRFDAAKIGSIGKTETIAVTCGQLAYEREHLCAKLLIRAPALVAGLEGEACPVPHPLFRIIDGGIEEWEVVPPR